MNAYELMRKKYPPLQEAVPGVLPFGQLAVLGGHTGVRKSWTVDELALGLTEGPLGGGWLGQFAIPKAVPVLLIANEDNEQRIQSRLRQIREGRPPLLLTAEMQKQVNLERETLKQARLEAKFRRQLEKEADLRLDIRMDFPSYEQGGLDELRVWIEGEGQPCVVIFDVFANFREAVGSFRRDRRMISEIARFSHTSGALIVAVMHMYKGVIQEGSNWTDKLVGSGGVGAATDVKIGINAVEGADQGRLLMYGKDILNQAYKLELTEAGIWKAGTDEGGILNQSGREVSEQRKLLLRVVGKNPGRTPAQIHELQPVGPDGKPWTSNNVKVMLHGMWRKSKPPQIINESGGYYTPEYIKDRDDNQPEMLTPALLPTEQIKPNPFRLVN